ncbi:Hypothetical_protein [Hexamita inflata]|uniref:Hypothetical_protein n=1 Tax=Hexamita inflata TaxID=28002 RepID=A0AA86PEV8_9EUKA|nr:Hypothetical protein HINF_LOCUS25640 [Hexamita inflata]
MQEQLFRARADQRLGREVCCKSTLFVIVCIILSPLIVLAFCLFGIFYVTVVIISAINNLKLISKYKSNRKKLFACKVLVPDNPDPNPNSMFFFKPSNMDLFFSMNSGQIQFTNTGYANIHSQQSKYQFQPGQKEKFCATLTSKSLISSLVNETEFSIPPSYFSNVFICKQKVYFNVLDFVFVLQDNFEIQMVNQVPNFGKYVNVSIDEYKKLDFTGGHMFTLNDKLYIHNNSSKLFQVRGKSLRCVNRKHFNMHYYQFCDKVYAVGQYNIFKVENNLKLVEIENVAYPRIVFAQGGVLVLIHYYYNSYAVQNYYVLNMLDGVITTIKQDEVDLSDIPNVIALGPAGWQLKNEILARLCGADFPQRMVDYFNNYQKVTLEKSKYKKNAFGLVFKSDLKKLVGSQFLIEQLFQQVCGRRLIELRGLFYVINFVETKQCQACQYFHFAPNKNNANNE